MNLPYRSTATTRRPASDFAVAWGAPRSTLNWRNSALIMRRPTIVRRSDRTTVSTSGSSGMADKVHFGKVNQDLAGVDANGVRRDLDLIIEDASSRRGVELPGVPRAGYEPAVQRTLTQRTALMRASTGEGANLAFDVAEGVQIAA